ncbi:hypothetical protein CANCADRAFT_31209 [Tortispora caseinolytica NRRL Y-17796]|uniref:BRCT domain-containing protein n=1 Tax=Tortispora caseinolytica NRRL Y-17796 TaxID=767744 RepID=A0A1E4TEG3_9ASCO|nr:hypothetical protein CANCADRAFT_31209 [Tortispora caseinolytica NRRL Y-17796]
MASQARSPERNRLRPFTERINGVVPVKVGKSPGKVSPSKQTEFDYVPGLGPLPVSQIPNRMRYIQGWKTSPDRISPSRSNVRQVPGLESPPSRGPFRSAVTPVRKLGGRPVETSTAMFDKSIPKFPIPNVSNLSLNSSKRSPGRNTAAGSPSKAVRFADDKPEPEPEPELVKPLTGLRVFVDVSSSRNNEACSIVKTKLKELGATVQDNLDEVPTHIVFRKGNNDTVEYASDNKAVHFVSIHWVLECMNTLARAKERNFSMRSMIKSLAIPSHQAELLPQSQQEESNPIVRARKQSLKHKPIISSPLAHVAESDDEHGT